MVDINGFINKLSGYPQWEFMIGLFFIAYLVTLFICLMLWPKLRQDFERDQKLKNEQAEKLSNKTKYTKLLSIYIIGPYIETLIFQFCIFRLIEWIYSSGYSTIIAFYVSTIVFAISHGLVDKDWTSIFLHLPVSAAFGLIFMISDIKQTKAVLYTFLFHAIWNIVSYIVIPESVGLYTIVKEKIKNTG